MWLTTVAQALYRRQWIRDIKSAPAWANHMRQRPNGCKDKITRVMYGATFDLEAIFKARWP
uniref:Uncharacterized protein n=1 Tax=Oryza punctata TaxID=4537 RepID=A0A0E0LC57_ORYPU